MLISPLTAIKEGWIKGIVDEKQQVQPNAIDFTLDKLFEVDGNSDFILTEDRKVMRKSTPATLLEGISEGTSGWRLRPNGRYDGMSDIYVELPEGVAAKLIIRSTLNRNGVFLTSGLYDSGFKGNIGFMLHNVLGTSYLGKGTRVGQIEFYKSDSAGLYAGGYNTEKGKHWADTETDPK